MTDPGGHRPATEIDGHVAKLDGAFRLEAAARVVSARHIRRRCQIVETRPSDTWTVARLAHIVIRLWAGCIRRIWYAMNAMNVPRDSVPATTLASSDDQHRRVSDRPDQCRHAAGQVPDHSCICINTPTNARFDREALGLPLLRVRRCRDQAHRLQCFHEERSDIGACLSHSPDA